MTQLELFRATTRHEPHAGLLYYASFTPDLERRVREAFGLSAEADIRSALGMWNPCNVVPVPPHRPAPDFSPYFADMEKSPGAFINANGVLEIPSGFYRFTGYSGASISSTG